MTAASASIAGLPTSPLPPSPAAAGCSVPVGDAGSAMSFSTGETFVDGLRPQPDQLEQLVRVLDDDRHHAPRKHARRVVENGLAMLLTLRHLGGSTTRFRVFPWDISRGGLGFFHKCFVHPGTTCTLEARAADGRVVRINAVVARSIYVMGTVHYVGVRFELELDVDELLGPNIASPHSGADPRTALNARRRKAIDPWFEKARSLADALREAIDSQACRELVRERALELQEFLKR